MDEMKDDINPVYRLFYFCESHMYSTVLVSSYETDFFLSSFLELFSPAQRQRPWRVRVWKVVTFTGLSA